MGGEVLSGKHGRTLLVRKADAVTILMAGATDYQLEYPHYKGDLPEERNRRIIEKAKAKSYDQLRVAHIRDYQRLFNRVDLDLGEPSRTTLPTDARLTAYKKDRNDRGLETLLFQYGLYS